MASDAGKTDELESSHHPGTNGGGGYVQSGPQEDVSRSIGRDPG